MHSNSLPPWAVFAFTALCFIFTGCAPADVSIQIEDGVPADQLSYYATSFDVPKKDLWEIAAFSQPGQLANFKMADVTYENGRLKMEAPYSFHGQGMGGDFHHAPFPAFLPQIGQ